MHALPAYWHGLPFPQGLLVPAHVSPPIIPGVSRAPQEQRWPWAAERCSGKELAAAGDAPCHGELPLPHGKTPKFNSA